MSKIYISALLGALLAVQMAHAQESMDDVFVQLDTANAAAEQPAATSSANDKVPAGQAASVGESEMLSRLFGQGVELYKAGKYDEAIRVFDAMLSIDKYDSRAMTHRERAAKRVASKGAGKQGATRAQAIADVDAAWNPDPRGFGPVDASEGIAVAKPDQQAIDQMTARLKAITIPSLEFDDARIEEVVRFFAETSRGHGNMGEDVDILLVGMESAMGGNITLSMADVKLYEALQYVVEMAALKFEIKPNLVVIMPSNYVPASELTMRSYDIIPEVGTDLESAGDSGDGAGDLFGDSSFHKLFVKNTPKNLKAVEAILADLDEEAIKHRSQQVQIEAKFVEFNEGALEELGFDWNMFGSGTAASLGLDGRDVTAGAAANSTTLDPITGQPIYSDNNGRPGQNVLGSAQRNNTTAFASVERGMLQLLGGTPATMLFNNGDIDLQITAMEQEGTADVMSAPMVTTKSGTEATIRVAETHRYPQDYDVETGQRTAPVVKPQDWEDFDMGVSLKVTPVVDSDSNTIELDLLPEIMMFKGFDLYVVGFNAYDVGGNNTSAAGGDGRELLAKMPSFERRVVQTQVVISDGSTVVMGGMVDERTETFRDQVPFLGDIPYLGRLFRSEGSRSTKKNLTIFVKATQIDARGMTHADRELARQ